TRHLDEPNRALARDRLGVLFRRHDDEIVATAVPDEILVAPHHVHRVANRVTHVPNHHVRDRETERVRKRLEVVEIDVADRESFAQLRPPRYLIFDRLTTREPARRIAIALAPHQPQQRHDPRSQLARIERLRQVVIGARLECFHFVFDIAARREHQHGNPRGERIQLHSATHLDPRHPRHHEIEHHQLRLARLNRGQCRRAVRREMHVVPRRSEDLAHHEAHVLVIVDAQDVTHD
ncbi:MAG TPA: hypothetical protein VGL90_05205, partial [Casimicrobiaceae bacterium]